MKTYIYNIKRSIYDTIRIHAETREEAGKKLEEQLNNSFNLEDELDYADLGSILDEHGNEIEE